ncbi:MAG TPA: hypothetical protein VMV53_10745, partial [Acidimicrobiales bacterium]|nr:hypothetical protein [Acidimicrobiales bacterium]
KFVKAERGRRAPWVECVYQFRVMVNRGTRLHPAEVTILVLTKGREFEAEQKDPLRNWLVSLRKEFKKACDGAQLCPLTFERTEQLPLVDYQNSVPLRIPSLGRSIGFTLG